MPRRALLSLVGLFGLCGLWAGCHGELVDLSEHGALDAAEAPPDLSMAEGPRDMAGQVTPPAVVYRSEIHDDMIRLGCAAVDVCHKGQTGTARLRLFVPPSSDADWQAEYAAARTFAMKDSASELLTFPRMTGDGAKHTGGAQFKSEQDPDYVKWLGWIRAGAPFTPDGGSGGDGGAP